MIMWKFSVVIILCFSPEKTWTQSPISPPSNDAVELRTMLQSAVTQNRHLHAQNKRLKVIWAGIEKMCTSITPTCNCEAPATNNNVEHKPPSVVQNLVSTKVRDPPPPSVEFYRHNNGQLVNSAQFNDIKEKQKQLLLMQTGHHKNTVSSPPIAEVLKDLNISPFKDNSPGTKPTTTPPIIVHSHTHRELDLMHEMLGPHSHKDPHTHHPTNQQTGQSMRDMPLLDLVGPDVIGQGHMESPVVHHQQVHYTTHTDSPTSMAHHKHQMAEFDIINEVNGKTRMTDYHRTQQQAYNTNVKKSHHNLNSKLVLNDLLLATEQSIQEKQNAVHQNQQMPLMTNSADKSKHNIVPQQSVPVNPSLFQPMLQPPTTLKRTPTTTTTTTTTPAPKVIPYVKLSIKAVSSEGLVTNTISATVRYTAPSDHTTEWLQLQSNGATTRTSGVRVNTAGGPESEYLSNMVFVDANATRHALFRLFGNNKSISLQFNLTELQLSGEQLLPVFEDDIVNFNDTVMAQLHSDLVIDLEVRGSPGDNQALRHTEVFFTGLNITTTPPTVFEIVHFNSEGVSVSVQPRTMTTSTMRITLKRPYIDFGGILTVRLPQTVGGYLDGYYYGHLVRVLEFYTQEVIPFGNFGVYYLPKMTLVRDPSQSILCAAMGNPPPDVVILKVAPDGKEKATLTETIMLDTVTNMKSLTLYADKPVASEGKYICRASIGTEVVDSTTEVVVVSPPEFVDVQTGVTSNTTNQVTISCKATGKPRPDMEMRLYEDHGPDLAKTGLYKTSLLTPDKDTAQLTLTVSSNDREIHTVVCVAKQKIPDSKDRYRQVIVFPKSDDYTNWYLYNRLQNMATGW